MKKLTTLLFFVLITTYSKSQNTTVNHYLNVNISFGNSFLCCDRYDRNYQFQLDYDIAKRLNAGIHYGFNNYKHSGYVSIFDDYIGYKYKFRNIGGSLQFSFISFKKSSFNADKHYGIYLKASIDHRESKINLTEISNSDAYIVAITNSTIWNKNLSLGINIPIIKHLGFMGECMFLESYNGHIYGDNPTWRAGITYQLLKMK